MTDRQLRTMLAQVAAEATIVDLRAQVRARARVVRRRRRMAAVAVPVAVVVAIGAVLFSPSRPEAAAPADRRAPTLDLAAARTGGLAGAELSVVDADTGRVWVATDEGRAARLSATLGRPSGTVPQLSSGGEVLAIGRPGRATVVRTVDGSRRGVAVPADGDYLPAVSPDGRTLAYAQDDQVDSIDLTLVPLDGSAPTTLPVSTSAASGQLVPVVWSDDASALLVLEGAGATRVDLVPVPKARPGVHLPAEAVLANGWAAAPDLSRFLMSAPGGIGNGRRVWREYDAKNGRVVHVFTRPAGDRLIGWTTGDRLMWWHASDGAYTVLSTDSSGTEPRVELRVRSTLPHLRATWTGDRP